MYSAFIQKEIIENIRNYKLIVICLVFAMVGFGNPILAKLTPELLATSGLDITIQTPSAIDSWIQFYKNISILLIVFIIMFSSTIASELNNHSLINMVTKGLPRYIVIVAKYTVIAGFWLIVYGLYFGITLVYTPLLLEGTLDHLVIASLLPFIFGLLMISLSLLGGVVTKNTIGSLIFPFGFYLGSSLLSMFNPVSNYLPTRLMTSLSLINGDAILGDYLTSIVITLCLTILVLIISIASFNKQQL